MNADSETVEDYLPYLFSIEAGLDNIFQQNKVIVTSWRCTLIGTALRNQPRVEVPSIDYEITFTLLTYAYALTLRANTLIRRNEEKVVSNAAENICKAAGILQYIQSTVLATWVPAGKIPVDATKEVISILILLSIADAQILGLTRAKSASFSLIARICVSTYEMLNSASSLINSYPRRKELDDDLIRYINDNKTLARARVLKYLAFEAEQNGEVGEAVTCITEARNLVKIASSSKVEILQWRAKEEFVIIDAKYKELKRHNDRVAFQPEPLLSDVQAKMPSGRDLVQPKSFIKPILAFGDEKNDDQSSDAQPTEQNLDSDQYAGRGSYY